MQCTRVDVSKSTLWKVRQRTSAWYESPVEATRRNPKMLDLPGPGVGKVIPITNRENYVAAVGVPVLQVVIFRFNLLQTLLQYSISITTALFHFRSVNRYPNLHTG